MKVFIDTHIAIDYLVNNEKNALHVINNTVTANYSPVISTLTVAILNYFIDKKFKTTKKKKEIATAIQNLFDIATPIPSGVPKMLQHYDWEDAFQYYSAKQAKCRLLITDNIHDYPFAEIELMNVKTFNSLFL